MQENVEQVKERMREERGDLPRKFLVGTVSYILSNKNKALREEETRGKKRKEPNQKDNEAAEKPELKKTKKCEDCGK